MKYCLDS